MMITTGMVLYMYYIAYIGGNFMAVRFFTPVILFGVLKFRYLSFKNLYLNFVISFLIIIPIVFYNVYENNSSKGCIDF